MTKVPFELQEKKQLPGIIKIKKKNGAEEAACKLSLIKRLRNSTDARHDKKKIAEHGPVMAAKNMTERRFARIPTWPKMQTQNGKSQSSWDAICDIDSTPKPRHKEILTTIVISKRRTKRKHSRRNHKQYSQLRRITTEQPRSNGEQKGVLEPTHTQKCTRIACPEIALSSTTSMSIR